MAVPNVVLMACGSFSPPTPMHFRMFEIARDHFRQMGTHNVIGGIMSPVHDAYKKGGLVSSMHRCNMIRLGLQTSDWIRLSDWETRQEGWTRTRNSLQYHQNYINSYLNDDLNDDTTDLQLPQWLPHTLNDQLSPGPVQLKLLCGADILESFSVPNLWDPDDLETILGQHGIVVITRSGSNPEQFIFNSDQLTKYRRNITLITNWVSNEVSSTMARRLIARGDSVKYLLDDRIVEYIRAKGLFMATTAAHKTQEQNNNDNKTKYNVQDGMILNLNKLNRDCGQAQHRMAVTPSPEDVLDAPDTNHVSEREDDTERRAGNVFCCDPMASSKHRHSDGRKQSSRRRRGPGQAVQVLFEGTPEQQSQEVRHGSMKDSRGSGKSLQSSSFASGSGHTKSSSLSIISSAPQLNHALPLTSTTTATPPPSSASRSSSDGARLTRHSSLRQPPQRRDEVEALVSKEEVDTRNYDDMIKFILTEHGIRVISEKEFVV